MGRLVFTGGSVFDGTGAPPAPGDVVIEGDRVVEVGAPGLDADEAVDCTGLVVLPGLFDCHTHVVMSGELDLQRVLHQVLRGGRQPRAVAAHRAHDRS